ncbi:hypothetical protein HDU97_007802 [Phlyctochytrium planicorne]|nr:hypothetical protein HDU97_007802 [Phlyctochytrium planicorne]
MNRPSTDVQSLTSLCLKCLERNVEKIRHFDTSFGEVPPHLMFPVLKKTTPNHLEQIFQYHRSSLKEYDELWKPFVLKEFGDVRRSIERKEFELPESGWRDLYLRRLKERSDNLMKAKRKLEQNRKEAEKERSKKKVMVLERPLDTKAKPRHWSQVQGKFFVR